MSCILLRVVKETPAKCGLYIIGKSDTLFKATFGIFGILVFHFACLSASKFLLLASSDILFSFFLFANSVPAGL